MAGLVTLTSLAHPSLADDLPFPVDCTLGKDCFIQNYVDRDPGAGATDFTCGPLTYDGHNGTDIRLIDESAMAEGVDVLSASSGIVLGTRDGMPDIPIGRSGAPDISGRECGNGVLVQRADGWRLQYCHLRKGSVAVRQGQTIAEGEVLGQIGLSGKTQFPHLHLVIRDQAGRVMDPFDARQQDESCRLKDRRTLWRGLDPQQDYQPGGPMAAGFWDRVPEYIQIKTGDAHLGRLSSDTPALVFWAHFFGLRKGDQVALRLNGPNGEEIVAGQHIMKKNRAVEFRAIGRKRREDWAKGTYAGEALLIREGRVLDRISAELIAD